MNLVPGLNLRSSGEEESVGIDDAQLGEFAYDYVEFRREFSDVIMGEGDPEANVAGSMDAGTPQKEMSTEKA